MIKKAINYIYIGLLILSCLALLVDIWSVIANPKDYGIAHGFREVELKWNSPSVLQYIKGDIIDLIIAGLFLVLALFYLKKKGNKLLAASYYISILIFLSLAFFNYYQWIKTGFDH